MMLRQLRMNLSRMSFQMLALSLVFVYTTTASEEIKVEVCEWENLQLNCPSRDTVISFQYALYGRMENGRCLRGQFTTEGRCSMNVQSYLERQCAGRRSCNVTVPNQDLHRLSAGCPYGLSKYLKVSYFCETVFNPSDKDCSNQPLRIPIASSPSGYLASVITEDTDKGSYKCPWSFELESSQTINLALLDFGVWQPPSASQPSDEEETVCTIYAQIYDGQSSTGNAGTVVCRGNTREKIVYTKSGGTMNVTVTKLKKAENPNYFLIRYEVVGCAAFLPPPGMQVVERQGSGYIVRCADINVPNWEVRCDSSGRWTPFLYSNCSGSAVVTSPSAAAQKTSIDYTQAAMIVVVIAISVIISAIIIVSGLYCLHKCPFQKNLNLEMVDTYSVHTPTFDKYAGSLCPSRSMRELYPMLANPDRGQTDFQRDYATTLQMRQLAIPSAAMQQEMLFAAQQDPHAWGCPVHGARTAGILTGNGTYDRRLQNNNLRLRMDHIYEMPAFDMSPLDNGQPADEVGLVPASPFYHELDPNVIDGGNAQPSLIAPISSAEESGLDAAKQCNK